MQEIELLFGALIFIIGVSHVCLAKEWAELFKDLQKYSYAAPMIGLLTIVSGLPIVLFHNVWVIDLSVITTIVGWFWTLKSIKYLVVPNSYKYKYNENSYKSFIVVGVGMVIVGGLMIVGYFC
ncbi:hypothetical protein [Chengkuizengella axinellae]|uniref:DUF3995 domain-containing protein n=1 Tax=Chengkuizengella axinellae TaxID=3064388 RepID=A0ABT9J3S1_9BACL|nr:hypothetical protein [Chengkuizengella sp. 2205SS18-9]MDP5276266.1 hypothetical protein [Chengkuizengella sp. 2205SS18-9]